MARMSSVWSTCIMNSGPLATAQNLAAAIAKGELASRDLLEEYVARIERLNPALNAVVTLSLDRARTEADAADATVARGDTLGPLHGLPITIKDAIATGGIRSTGGAVELRDHVPDADAEAVARLRAAGAIVFGKTNVPRWSGDVQTFNEVFGTTNNPWALDRIPGGSSGGPAAAVACGLTAFELGTDIGGSVRIPAHCCGTFGLKPSFGVVPQRGYLDHVGGGTTDADINVFGPIARSADDLGLLLDVLAAAPAEQRPAWRIELPPARFASTRGLRVAVWFDQAGMVIDPSYRALLGDLADALSDAGAAVTTARAPIDFAEQNALFSAMILAAISPSLDDTHADALSGSHRQWLRLEQQRAQVRRAWAEWFETIDVLLCPVLPCPAFPHNQQGTFEERTVEIAGVTRPLLDAVAWTGLIGITGQPSAVAPIGRVAAADAPDGLPCGVQIVAGYLRDREAVAGARLVEDLIGGFMAPPIADT
jgi:amidase